MDARGTPEAFRDCSGPRFHQFWLPNPTLDYKVRNVVPQLTPWVLKTGAAVLRLACSIIATLNFAIQNVFGPGNVPSRSGLAGPGEGIMGGSGKVSQIRPSYYSYKKLCWNDMCFTITMTII